MKSNSRRKSVERFKLTLQCVVVILIALMVCSCGAPKGFVAKEWAITMREMGIVPVFPPREDVQVGDIYAAPALPEEEERLLKKKGFLPIGLWMGSVSMSNELSQFYQSRNSFPTTSLGGVTSNLFGDPSGLVPQPFTTNNIFNSGDTGRLRMVGFPEFMSATFSQGDVSGVVPVEAVSIALGGSVSSSQSVKVSIPVAESYGLPAAQMFNKVVNSTNRSLLVTNLQFRAEDIMEYTRFQHARSPNKEPGFGYIRLITEVYYARAIDVSVLRKKTGGGGASVRPVISTSSSSSTNSVGGTNFMTVTRNSDVGPEGRVGELNQQLTQAMAQTAPGVNVKFVTASDRGVSLRRTYERPIAIGYRGLLLKVHTNATVENLGGFGEEIFVPTKREEEK